jgi:UDP-N-acetylmuramate: L-alanyl-gamma-D-glutamyl-meso-diaminopimelate ligase
VIPEAPHHIHLVACCGTAMGSLAGMLKARGYHITGSDQHVYPPMSTQLAAWGIPIYEGFDAAHLNPRPDLVVIGNVATRDNAEAAATREAGIAAMSFPQALAHFFIQDRHGVVVTGTHGKSTTTALIAWVLTHAGYDPNVFVGAVMRNFDSTFRLGEGPHMVIEGDEYDSAYFDKGPKFLHYRPRTAVLTSIEFDHADIYRDFEHVRSAFVRFLNIMPAGGCLVACADHHQVREVIANNPVASAVQTYGIEPGADWRAEVYTSSPEGTELTVAHQGKPYGQFRVPLYGPHNVQNVLATIAVASRLGLTPAQIAAALATYAHIKRRLEVRGTVGDVTVIDDFAHHPTAVQVTLEGVRQAYPGKRIWAVFEPRTATSRRNVFQQDYIRALQGADHVILSDIHRKEALPPSERLSPETIVEALREHMASADFHADTSEIIDQLCRDTRPGDVVIVMSNGGFDHIHERLLTALAQR